jgi:tetratricopeptide (TPR) repeat protein
MVLFMREGRYTESLSNARILSAKYPRSYLFALNISQILRIIGKKEEAVAALLNVEKQADAGVPNFDKLQMRTFRYQIGSELMKLGRWDLARERFQKSIENRQTPDRERSLSHLSIGRILDANGRHSEAIKQYQTVLTLADYEDSHEQARKLLKQPR